MEKEKVLLKNLLFNKEKVEMIANAIGEACKSKKINNFDKSSFVKSILNEFPEFNSAKVQNKGGYHAKELDEFIEDDSQEDDSESYSPDEEENINKKTKKH